MKSTNNKLNKYLKNDFILIYQMGKVGSTFIEKNLNNTANIHTLYSNHPCPYNHSVGYLAVRRWCTEKIYEIIKKTIIKSRKKTKIITIYRDSAERNISMFMQDFPFWYTLAMRDGIINGKMEDKDLPYTIFKRKFPHEYPYSWFDKELKRLTGIDISNKIDEIIKNSTTEIETKKFNILIINYNDINNKETISAIENFCSAKIEIKGANASKDKWYSPIYNEIVDKKLNEIKNDYMRKFEKHKFQRVLNRDNRAN